MVRRKHFACQSRIAASTKAGAAIEETEDSDAAFEGDGAANCVLPDAGMPAELTHFRCPKWDQIPYFSIRR